VKSSPGRALLCTPLVTALAIAFAQPARAVTYQVIVPMPIASSQSRTATCEDIYGALVAPLISYTGGPLSQTRQVLSQHSFGPWITMVGECLRNYQATRAVPASCPANQQGTASANQERDWTLNDAGATVSDTGYVTKSTDYSCDYYYLSTQQETKTETDSCPANQRGTGQVRNYQRSYDLWSDSSKRNYTDWALTQTTAATCAYYYVSTQTAYSSSTDACPSNQTGTGATHYYSQTYDLWSDGSKRNYSAWTQYQVSASSCTYYYVSTQTEYTSSFSPCEPGMNGNGVTTNYSRTYQLWSDGSKRNYSGWTFTGSTGSCWWPASCFPAGSMVLMADGSQKEITTLAAGDMVMGPTGPWRVDYLYRTRLGGRRMLSTRDRHFVWTEEHLIWARDEGRQWWWSGHAQGLRDEVASGLVVGLFDNNSIMEEGDPEFANLDFTWVRPDIVDATAEYSPLTEVFEPWAPPGDRRMAFIDGFLVTCGTNQWECDYSKFNWSPDQAQRVREMMARYAGEHPAQA
jgi:hypothetical protein